MSNSRGSSSETLSQITLPTNTSHGNSGCGHLPSSPFPSLFSRTLRPGRVPGRGYSLHPMILPGSFNGTQFGFTSPEVWGRKGPSSDGTLPTRNPGSSERRRLRRGLLGRRPPTDDCRKSRRPYSSGGDFPRGRYFEGISDVRNCKVFTRDTQSGYDPVQV